MDQKIKKIIENSILNARKQEKEFLLFGSIMIYVQDTLISDEVDFNKIVDFIEKRLTSHLYNASHLFDGIDVIYVGQFDEIIDRELEAFYESGAIFIANTLNSNFDYVENIIHEVAHSIEESHGLQIYGDHKLNSEFLGKRNRLFSIIKSQGYDIDDLEPLNPEYQEDMDMFLYQDIGYDKLNYLINGLFFNPYAVTSLSEYFASGFEKYLLDAEGRRRIVEFSPQLAKKLEELINGYQNLGKRQSLHCAG